MTSVIYICFFLIALRCGITESYKGWNENKEEKALDRLRIIQRRDTSFDIEVLRRLMCKRWNQKCQPWATQLDHTCCGGLTCKCNLWMQNCKCVSKLWG